MKSIIMFIAGAIAASILLPVAGQSVWLFIPDRPVEIRTDRCLDDTRCPLLYEAQPGTALVITGAYVQADDIIWAQLADRSGFVATARYGVCEIRAFGHFDPPGMLPASVNTNR